MLEGYVPFLVKRPLIKRMATSSLKPMKYHAFSNGFTLIEIMIVVAIIAILSSIAIPNFVQYRATAHAQTCTANINLIHKACVATQIRDGKTVTDLNTLCSGSAPFLKNLPTCPVGGTYSISLNQQTGDFIVSCSKYDAESHNVKQK